MERQFYLHSASALTMEGLIFFLHALYNPLRGSATFYYLSSKIMAPVNGKIPDPFFHIKRKKLYSVKGFRSLLSYLILYYSYRRKTSTGHTRPLRSCPSCPSWLSVYTHSCQVFDTCGRTPTSIFP